MQKKDDDCYELIVTFKGVPSEKSIERLREIVGINGYAEGENIQCFKLTQEIEALRAAVTIEDDEQLRGLIDTVDVDDPFDHK